MGKKKAELTQLSQLTTEEVKWFSNFCNGIVKQQFNIYGSLALDSFDTDQQEEVNNYKKKYENIVSRLSRFNLNFGEATQKYAAKTKMPSRCNTVETEITEIEELKEYITEYNELNIDEEQIFLYKYLAKEMILQLSNDFKEYIMNVQVHVIACIGGQILMGWPKREEVEGKADRLLRVKARLQQVNIDAITRRALKTMLQTPKQNVKYARIVKGLYEIRKRPARIQNIPGRYTTDGLVIFNGKSTKISKIKKKYWEEELCFAFPHGAPEYRRLEKHAVNKKWWVPPRPKIVLKRLRVKDLSLPQWQLCIIHPSCGTVPLRKLTQLEWTDWLPSFAKDGRAYRELLEVGESKGWPTP